jgi:hypothetical protein
MMRTEPVMADLEPIDPQQAASELGKRFARPTEALKKGLAIAAFNCGLLAIAAIFAGMRVGLHQHYGLLLAVLPFSMVGIVCGWLARWRVLAVIGIVLSILAVAGGAYHREIETLIRRFT